MGEEWNEGAGEDGGVGRGVGTWWELTRVIREARSEYEPLPFSSACSQSLATSDLWM